MTTQTNGQSNAGQRESTDERRSATDKFAEVAHNTIDETADRARGIERKIRSGVSNAGEKLEVTQAAAAKSVRNSTARAEAFVKEKPIAAAGLHSPPVCSQPLSFAVNRRQ